jgi:adenylosuccinate synthase
VKYETMPGWTEDLSQAKTFEELPINCQNYINRLEELIGVPIKYIGVGSGRNHIVEKTSHRV